MKKIRPGYKQLLIYMREDYHTALKTESKERGMSMGKIIEEALTSRIIVTYHDGTKVILNPL